MSLPDPMSWRKSSRSQQETACVEIAPVETGAAVRDSKNPAGGYLTASPAQWRLFIAAVKEDRFGE